MESDACLVGVGGAADPRNFGPYGRMGPCGPAVGVGGWWAAEISLG
jgi:hypothetical protein